MIKINPVKTPVLKESVKKVEKKIEKPLIDYSTEEHGYFLVNGKVVPIIFPR